MAATPIRVSIIDDDEEICRSLGELINKSDFFACVSVYPNCESALVGIDEDVPDVILLDIEMQGMPGSRGVEHLKRKLPGTEIIMLTIHDEGEAVFESLGNGATGYLMKNTPPDLLLHAIKEATEGGAPMSMKIARMVTESFHKKPPPEPLSPREQDVLEKLRKGYSYQAIADALFVSKSTVKFHIKNIYRKLHVSNKVAAVTRI